MDLRPNLWFSSQYQPICAATRKKKDGTEQMHLETLTDREEQTLLPLKIHKKNSQKNLAAKSEFDEEP